MAAAPDHRAALGHVGTYFPEWRPGQVLNVLRVWRPGLYHEVTGTSLDCFDRDDRIADLGGWLRGVPSLPEGADGG